MERCVQSRIKTGKTGAFDKNQKKFSKFNGGKAMRIF